MSTREASRRWVPEPCNQRYFIGVSSLLYPEVLSIRSKFLPKIYSGFKDFACQTKEGMRAT